MKQLKTILFLALAFVTTTTWATTWDEPWQDKVIKDADYFVYAKVKSYNEKKGVTIEIIKSLGGLCASPKLDRLKIEKKTPFLIDNYENNTIYRSTDCFDIETAREWR